MTGIEKRVGGMRLTFYADSVFICCDCSGELGRGRWFSRHFWERGPEKMIQRAIAHALGHGRKEQDAEAKARYAADYAEAVMEVSP